MRIAARKCRCKHRPQPKAAWSFEAVGSSSKLSSRILGSSLARKLLRSNTRKSKLRRLPDMGTNGVFSSRLAIWKQSHGFPHWSIGTSFQAGCGGLPFNSLLASCFPFLMLEGGPSHADPLSDFCKLMCFPWILRSCSTEG